LTTGVAYMAFRWPENGIPEGCWDHRLKVLWLYDSLKLTFLSAWKIIGVIVHDFLRNTF